MNLFGSFKSNATVSNFTSASIENPHILVIFPINSSMISESMDSISKIVSAYDDNNTQFSFLMDKRQSSKINFFNIKTIPVEFKKEKFLIHSDRVLNKLKQKKIDIVINLNTDFNFDIDSIVSEIDAKYKIGFITKYSDLFYNIQLNWDESGSRFKSIANILG